MPEFTKRKNCLTCRHLMSPFCLIGQEGLKVLNEDRYEVKYKAGEIVFKKGSPLTHIACLTNGMFKVYLEGPGNKNIILALISPKEIVGGPGFEVDYRHHFSVSAIEDSEACLVNIQKFREIVEADSKFALEVIGYLNGKNIKGYDKLLV